MLGVVQSRDECDAAIESGSLMQADPTARTEVRSGTPNCTSVKWSDDLKGVLPAAGVDGAHLITGVAGAQICISTSGSFQFQNVDGSITTVTDEDTITRQLCLPSPPD